MSAPTFADIYAAIERFRESGIEGWHLTREEAANAADWIDFLEGIGAPCPKISGFDEGLQLVWEVDGYRRYLALGATDAEGFVMKLGRVKAAAKPS